MTEANEIRTASAYLIIGRAKWRYDPPVIKSMRKEKPRLAPGEIAIKVSVRIPMAMFDEFIPEVFAELESQNVIVPEIDLEGAATDD